MNILAVSLFLFICLITLFAGIQVLAAKAREDCPDLHARITARGVPGLRWIDMACRPGAIERTGGHLKGIVWVVRVMVFVVLFVIVRLLIA